MIRAMAGTSLDGRRVLLTGAAGGIGRAIARELHARGATVLLSGRDEGRLEALRRELGERAEVAVADLARRADVDALAERARGVDVLVANAALPASGPLDDFTPEQIDRALDVNLRAPIRLAHALVPPMVERGAGSVVLVSSIAGKVATAGTAIYSATKFGLRGFAAALREDLHGTGVGVTVVYPGFIGDAGMFADARVELPRVSGGTRTAADVAHAVVAGVATGRGEIDVATVPIRVSATLSAVAPRLVAAIGRRVGAHRVSAEIAAQQREKR
jgi:uncharacterized protein